MPGAYDVTLTVTDDDGGTGTAGLQLDVGSPPADGTADFRAVAGSSRNSAASSVAVPGAVQSGDVLVLFVATNRLATVGTPAGWSLLGTRTDGSDLRSWAFTRTATVETAGSSVAITLDAQSKVDMGLVAYSGAGSVTATASTAEAGTGFVHTAPAAPVATPGSRVVHHWVTKTNSAVTWSLPAALQQRRSASGTGSGQVCSTTGDGGPAAAGTWQAQAATASVSSSKAIGWTVVVAPD